MIDGDLEAADGKWRIRLSGWLAHPPERVWEAVTEPEHLTAWFPTTIEGERRAGAPLRFRFSEEEGPVLEGRMVEYAPPSVMEFLWDEDRLRLELLPENGGTRLTLLHTFAEQGKAARDAAGWHLCLEQLGRRLDGAAGEQGEWRALFVAYGQRFGPAASSQGPPGGHPEAG